MSDFFSRHSSSSYEKTGVDLLHQVDDGEDVHDETGLVDADASDVASDAGTQTQGETVFCSEDSSYCYSM